MKHMKSTHFGNQRKVCNKCSEILGTNDTFKKHNEQCGRNIGLTGQFTEKSNEVCKHWRRGHCHKGNACNFSHVGYQKRPSVENHSTGSTRKDCKNGPSCSYLARGRCNFKHHNNNKHNGAQNKFQDRSGQTLPRQGSGRQQCRFGAGCDRVINCPNLHSPQDSPQFNRNQRFMKTNQNRNRS